MLDVVLRAMNEFNTSTRRVLPCDTIDTHRPANRVRNVVLLGTSAVLLDMLVQVDAVETASGDA
jgi:hypothetical protein